MNYMVGGSNAQRDEWARYQMMKRRESRYYTERIHEMRRKYAIKKQSAVSIFFERVGILIVIVCQLARGGK